MDQRWFEALVQLVAKRIDVDIYHVADAVEMDILHMFENYGAGDRSVGIAQQIFEQ